MANGRIEFPRNDARGFEPRISAWVVPGVASPLEGLNKAGEASAPSGGAGYISALRIENSRNGISYVVEANDRPRGSAGW